MEIISGLFVAIGFIVFLFWTVGEIDKINAPAHWPEKDKKSNLALPFTGFVIFLILLAYMVARYSPPSSS
jgi:hypothetical protein